LFNAGELEQTIRGAEEPYRTLFTVAALTGARLSELPALRWGDIRLADPDDSEIEFAHQVDRHGNLRPTKTEGSPRTVPIPRELALILSGHQRRSTYIRDNDFVFATRTGRPFGQQEHRSGAPKGIAQGTGRPRNPTFPILHHVDERGEPVPVLHGTLPSMHSFRHTVASRAPLAGGDCPRICVGTDERDVHAYNQTEEPIPASDWS
jgi:integrase